MTGGARLDPVQHGWLCAPELGAIFAALAAVGAEARVVGGAVRDALLERPVADIDLAVNVPPEQVEAALRSAGIRTVRTGYVHGTITAVLNHRGYEITSLRRDVATDGRHAAVAYTDAWEEDAARRDFTMNALYAAADGTLYDYHDGVADLRAGRVRFIGDPAARIAEDYLRVLRFFRFHAAFGRGTPDVGGLAACVAAAPHISLLSRERVTQEFRKLLLTGQPVLVLTVMQAQEILPQVLPLQMRVECLSAVLRCDAQAGLALRLAALLPDDVHLEAVLRAALRFSNAELAAVLALHDPRAAVDAAALPAALYRRGAAYCRDRLLLQAAETGHKPDPALLAQIAAWRAKSFPLTGDDLTAQGMVPGPELGALLRQVEDWWITGGFIADKAACLAEAKRSQQD